MKRLAQVLNLNLSADMNYTIGLYKRQKNNHIESSFAFQLSNNVGSTQYTVLFHG